MAGKTRSVAQIHSPPAGFYVAAAEMVTSIGNRPIRMSPVPNLHPIVRDASELRRYIDSFIPVAGRQSTFRGRADFQSAGGWVLVIDRIAVVVATLKQQVGTIGREEGRACQLCHLTLASNLATAELWEAVADLQSWFAKHRIVGRKRPPDLLAAIYDRFVHALNVLDSELAAALRAFPEDAAIVERQVAARRKQYFTVPRSHGTHQESQNTSSGRRKAAGGNTVEKAEYENRKIVVERWERFNGEYKALGYNRPSYEHFAAWANDAFDDMPSDEPAKLERMVNAHRKTPNPQKLV